MREEFIVTLGELSKTFEESELERAYRAPAAEIKAKVENLSFNLENSVSDIVKLHDFSIRQNVVESDEARCPQNPKSRA